MGVHTDGVTCTVENPCDDGLAYTQNDTLTTNCGCAGVCVRDLDLDGLCDEADPCPYQSLPVGNAAMTSTPARRTMWYSLGADVPALRCRMAIPMASATCWTSARAAPAALALRVTMATLARRTM